jgi:hypothetical protein
MEMENTKNTERQSGSEPWILRTEEEYWVLAVCSSIVVPVVVSTQNWWVQNCKSWKSLFCGTFSAGTGRKHREWSWQKIS